jgi:diaminopimelate decarboxylase
MVATEGSKFGVPLPEVAGMLQRFPFVTGLHVHIGSQVATKDDLVEGTRRVVELASRFPGIEWLDIGGGLPTRYHPSDPGLSPSDYLTALREAAPAIDSYRLITEVGRAVHAGCGWAATRVEYVEPGRAILHLGADFCLRECYQQDRWYHEIKVFDAKGDPKEGPTEPVDLFGPLCFSGDLVARARALPKLELGDLVVLCDVGAYTLSMWSRYCSRAIPEIVGYGNGAWTVLRNREKPQDLVKFWVGLG